MQINLPIDMLVDRPGIPIRYLNNELRIKTWDDFIIKKIYWSESEWFYYSFSDIHTGDNEWASDYEVMV